MLNKVHDIFSTIWNGLKRAVKFVVEVLLFIPKLIIEGIEVLFDIKEADAEGYEDKGDFIEYSTPPVAKKADTTEMKKIETCETKKQAQAVQEQSQKETKATNPETTEAKEKEVVAEKPVEVKSSESVETVEEDKEEKKEIAAEDHQDNQTGVTFEKLEGEIVDDQQELEAVEKEKYKSSKVDEPTEEEQNMLYDINYRIVEHIKESPFPKQDYELLKSYNAIADDLKKGNLGVTFTMRKASRDLIEAIAFRNGYKYNPLCLDEDARANDELNYLYSNNIITDEEHFVLNKRANEAILGTPDIIKAAEQQLIQMIDDYFYICYPKCDPRNTLENIRARKKAAEANSAAA